MPLDLIIWIVGFVTLLFAILIAPGLLRRWRSRHKRRAAILATSSQGTITLTEEFRRTALGQIYVNGEPRELPVVVNTGDVVTFEIE